MKNLSKSKALEMAKKLVHSYAMGDGSYVICEYDSEKSAWYETKSPNYFSARSSVKETRERIVKEILAKQKTIPFVKQSIGGGTIEYHDKSGNLWRREKTADKIYLFWEYQPDPLQGGGAFTLAGNLWSSSKGIEKIHDEFIYKLYALENDL